jgi:hypothetical protein
VAAILQTRERRKWEKGREKHVCDADAEETIETSAGNENGRGGGARTISGRAAPSARGAGANRTSEGERRGGEGPSGCGVLVTDGRWV